MSDGIIWVEDGPRLILHLQIKKRLSLYLVFIFGTATQALAAARPLSSDMANYCHPNSGLTDTDGHGQGGHQVRWTAPNGRAAGLPTVTGSSNWVSGG